MCFQLGFNTDLYQKYHKIWPTGFAKVAVQSVQAVLLSLSNNSSFKPREPQPFGTAVFSVQCFSRKTYDLLPETKQITPV